MEQNLATYARKKLCKCNSVMQDMQQSLTPVMPDSHDVLFSCVFSLTSHT